VKQTHEVAGETAEDVRNVVGGRTSAWDAAVATLVTDAAKRERVNPTGGTGAGRRPGSSIGRL
jgi:hypothetical protein